MADERKDTLRPTIVPTPSGRRKVAKPAKPAPEAAVSPAVSGLAQPALAPTAIPGVDRKRIEVTTEQLRMLAPGASQQACASARALVGSFVVEKATERRAILWGHDIQESYSEIVSKTLSLSQAPVLTKVQGHIRRTMDLLESIDVMAATGHGSGGLGGMFRGLNSRADTLQELRDVRAELEQLVALTKTALSDLLNLKEQLERCAVALDAAAAEADAASIAAQYLADHLQSSHPALARCFTDRAMSLTQTVAQIRNHGPIREIQIDQPIRMVSAIQNVTLVALPDFLAGLAAVTTLSTHKRDVSLTEASELNYKLRDIIGKLNG